MLDRSRRTLSHNRETIARAIRAAFPDIADADLARATGAAARAMIGATDTGEWHGPLEGYIGENYSGVSTPNGIHSAASWRMERRATDARDIGTLEFLAREYDRARATGMARIMRDRADMFRRFAADDAYVALSRDARTGNSTPEVPHGPAIREAYLRTDDVFVDVLSEDRDRSVTTVRHPMGYVCEVYDSALLEVATNPRLAR